jgi:Domain of unknown function (DUF4410)
MKISRLAPLLASCALAVSSPSPAKPASNSHRPQESNGSPASSMVVYVSDFELEVLNGRAPRRASSRNSPSAISGNASTIPSATQKNTPPGSSPKKPAPAPTADSQPDETPAEQADKLVNTMAENLVTALQKAGFKVKRLRTGQALPAEGLRIRGVFAEPDEQNRVRRLLVGIDPTTPKMLLYVGVNNLARPQQPLYELANPPGNDSKHGPVITVTSYSPAVRFEMDRNAADGDFKNIASEIVADLNALLIANPMMATH